MGGTRHRRVGGGRLHAARVDYARSRITAVLRRRIVTYRRELERKVCEVGYDYRTAPPEQRPEPHHFSEAMAGLVADGTVKEHNVKLGATPYRFWSLSSIRAFTVSNSLKRKVTAFTVFNAVEHSPPQSGWHAEGVHHKALTSSTDWASVGWAPGHKISTLGSYTIAPDQPGDVDLAGFHLPSSGIPFVAQVKNGREWLYPPDDAVWDLLGAAAQLHAVPILIARRLPDSAFTLMKLVGGFAFRSVKMILSPDLEHSSPVTGLPTLAVALGELGFDSDVDFISEPLPRHQSLWTGALTREIPAMHERFLGLAGRITEVAYNEQLRSDRRKTGAITKRPRRQIVEEFVRNVRAALREEAIERYRAEHPGERFDEDDFADPLA